MASTISEQLKATFDLASLRHEAKYLRKTSDWEKSREIRERFEHERSEQEKQYFNAYDTRVESMIKTLIDRKAEVNKDFKHRWFGRDNFDATLISKQAHRLVQHDHHRRVMLLNEREAHELNELVSQAKQRDALSNSAQQEFNNKSKQVTRQREFNNAGLTHEAAAHAPEPATTAGPTPMDRYR